MESHRTLGVALAVGLLLVGGLVAAVASQEAPAARPGISPPIPTVTLPAEEPGSVPETHQEETASYEMITWRASRAIGQPWTGRLISGVQLPREGPHFFTWDPARDRSPNRPGRRWGTDRLLRLLLGVLDRYAAAYPDSPRVGIGDLSRHEGGEFGARYGGLGHNSHQNGLDVDVYYPRRDGQEREPRAPDQIDRELAQSLLDLFVEAGAQYVFVGFRTPLTGPDKVVQEIAHHENHMHVRIFRSDTSRMRTESPPGN